MGRTHRRYWVFFLLFLFSAIAYLDRVNMSVAGKPIAHEFGLSPIALGYLFSSFLWAYVLMMLPGGRLIDRWGPHVVASVATAVWSTAQMATGMVGSFAAMLMVRLGLGVGEAPFAPISYSSVRIMVALYRARHRDCRDLLRVYPRAGTRRTGRRLADRDIVVALVLYHHRCGRICLGSGLGGAGLNTAKRPGGCPQPSATTSSPGATPASRRRATAASAISG